MGAQDGQIYIVVNDNNDDDKNTAESDQGQGRDSKGKRTEITFAPSDYKATTPGHSRLDRKSLLIHAVVATIAARAKRALPRSSVSSRESSSIIRRR